MTEARNICFTINNYSDHELNPLKEWNQVSFLVYGKEIGENQTPHLQCYAEFNSSKKFTTIKKKIPRAHIEKRKGTAMEAAGYCKKGSCEDKPLKGYSIYYDTPHETWVGEQIGTLTTQGARTDITAAAQMIKAKAPMIEVADAHPEIYIKYHKGLEKYEDLHRRHEFRTEMTEGLWLYGTTGSGKSHQALHDFHPDTHYIWKLNDNGWQDG
ncbi:hypothetical protein, partial [Shewanella sp.]|uniref:hypothetical protein n=1 Tax=Shewanella sp. TaxID=50422 RepID=UPI00404801F8